MGYPATILTEIILIRGLRIVLWTKRAMGRDMNEPIRHCDMFVPLKVILKVGDFLISSVLITG